MNIKNELNKIWGKGYQLPEFVKKRGFVFSINDLPKEILITGINPSYRKEEKEECFGYCFQGILKNPKWDTYWSPLKRILFNDTKDSDSINIDLRDKAAYLDIFYFREKEQKKLRTEILNSVSSTDKCSTDGVNFLVDQLKITQNIIEKYIKPKVIIVKNKESSIYWGRYAEDGVIWMGYKLGFVDCLECGEVYKISGLINSEERINKDIRKTNLIGTLILFSSHINQYTKKEKRPTPKIVNQLLNMYYEQNKDG